MRRLLCWLMGHRWTNERFVCHRSLILTHLHSLAGAYADCARCGERWDDVCFTCKYGTPEELGQ